MMRKLAMELSDLVLQINDIYFRKIDFLKIYPCLYQKVKFYALIQLKYKIKVIILLLS